MVRSCRHHALETMRSGLATAWALTPQIETGLPIQAIHAFVVDMPALAPQQDIDSPEAVAHPRGRDLLHTSQQRRIVLLLGLVVPTSPALAQYSACAPHARTVTFDQVAHERLALRGP